MNLLTLKYIILALLINLASSIEQDVDQQSFLPISLGEGDHCENDPNLVGFYLYPNATNANYSEKIRFPEQDSLEDSQFTYDKHLLLIIHGYLNNYTTTYSRSMKNAYLKNGYADTLNIILVDWGKLAKPCNSSSYLQYPFAVENVPIVGKRVGEFIMFLSNANVTSIENVHIDGFSLGAHVSGIAGDYVKQNSSRNIGRITGIDPAGPLFGIPIPVQSRLKSSDAAFVDVIHTDKGQYGIIDEIGHVDFYPNSGIPPQPGCFSTNIGHSASCSHNRAWEYYIHALTNKVTACKCSEYLSYKLSCKHSCPNATVFGENVPSTVRGSYYFDITL